MYSRRISRRQFLTGSGAVAGTGIATRGADGLAWEFLNLAVGEQQQTADYTLYIKTSSIEIAPKRIISATTYNGQFPGPLLRFKDEKQVTIDIYNDTDTPEQLHWHGQKGFSRC